MRIAFFTYPAAFQNVGGGEIQLLKTKEYLEKRGIDVDLFDAWRGRIEDYDVLHIFGSVKDCLGLARVAKSRGVKVATSPVLWSSFRRALFTDGGPREKAAQIVRHLAKVALPFLPSSRRKLLMCSDVLFPNSEAEKKLIARLFAVPSGKIRPVPNGVDPSFAEAEPALFRSRYGKEPFVLTVGRIEPRKNQLNLIRAMKGKGIRLVQIGSAVSGYSDYEKRCRKEGEGFVTFLETLPHGDPLLASAYAACELFVLPGWFETPGLAALEAALAGARLLVTEVGSTREYFAGSISYLDPSSVADISRKIDSALHEPRPTALRRVVLENYTWDKVAEKYEKYYRELAKNGA